MSHAKWSGRARLSTTAILTVLILAALTCVMFATAGVSSAAGQFTIVDDATGGQCTQIGSWDQYSHTCTLTGDLTSGLSIGSNGITIDGNGHSLTGTDAYGVYVEGPSNVTIENLTTHGFSYGIFLSFSGGNKVRFCTITDAYSEGIGIWGSSNNDITGNTILRSGEDGIGIVFGDTGMKIRGNTIADNGWGVWFAGAGADNYIYDNSFSGNLYAHVDGSGGPGIFNVAAPGGGNYWADWTGPDANGDGFVDAPRANPVGQDNLPHASAGAWCGKPQLSINMTRAFWENFADFSARILTITYDVHNSSADALDFTIVGSTATNGVMTTTPLPDNLGDIAQNSSWLGQLKYNVPPGVSSFRVTTFATVRDICGGSYSYPGPYAGA